MNLIQKVYRVKGFILIVRFEIEQADRFYRSNQGGIRLPHRIDCMIPYKNASSFM